MSVVMWDKNTAYLGETSVGSAYQWGDGASWTVYLPDEKGDLPPTTYITGKGLSKLLIRHKVEDAVQEWMDRTDLKTYSHPDFLSLKP
ncbi:hypothetical protein ACCS66_03930 [Rhizobium ruizarguesonis]